VSQSLSLLADERLDEIAVNSRLTIPARTIVAVGAGAVAAMNFGLLVGLGWMAAAVFCEVWTWFATNPHARGHVSPPQRAHYAVSLVCAVVVWTLLGLYAWRSHLPLQQAAAVAIWTSQLVCAASFAFQSIRGFVLIAAPPSLAMLVAPFIAPHGGLKECITVFAMFTLCILYAFVTARQTAGFRKALDESQESLRRSEARAEASARAKTEFLANMSHELRTPLTAIIGFAGLLRGSPGLQGEDARRAGLIQDASTTLLTVLNDVLDVSKMEAGALALEARPFDLTALVRDTVAFAEVQAQDKALWLRLEAPAGPIPVVGDANRLRQILMNLLTNAVKFTRAGGVTVSLDADAVASGTRAVKVAVKDTGIGVAEDKQALLFDRFAQADGSISREFGGTGLGLAICRHLVETMGGRIGLDSKLGQGSTFWFELALPGYDGDLAAPLQAPRPAAVSGSMQLLIAEDHPVNQELLTALLAPYDMQIDMVDDGAQALQRAQAKRYDLILMDVQMPVMDGVIAARHIRSLPGEAASTPIVAMTANVFPEQVAEYRAAGMDGHLGKPIDPRALFDMVERYAPQPSAD
jgi:signal transduction histidine kinase